MNKKKLHFALSGAMISVLTVSPLVNAQENPFGMQKISGAQVLADAKMPEGGCSGKKMKEGKCGEGKCGANKNKMKEAGCSGVVKEEEKMMEGGCSGKMKEAGCSGKM